MLSLRPTELPVTHTHAILISASKVADPTAASNTGDNTICPSTGRSLLLRNRLGWPSRRAFHVACSPARSQCRAAASSTRPEHSSPGQRRSSQPSSCGWPASIAMLLPPLPPGLPASADSGPGGNGCGNGGGHVARGKGKGMGAAKAERMQATLEAAAAVVSALKVTLPAVVVTVTGITAPPLAAAAVLVDAAGPQAASATGSGAVSGCNEAAADGDGKASGGRSAREWR